MTGREAEPPVIKLERIEGNRAVILIGDGREVTLRENDDLETAVGSTAYRGHRAGLVTGRNRLEVISPGDWTWLQPSESYFPTWAIHDDVHEAGPDRKPPPSRRTGKPAEIHNRERKMPQDIISYYVNIPEDLVDELANWMKQRNLTFGPNRSVIALNENFMDLSVAMGQHVPALLKSINDHLRENDCRPAVPENHEDWTPAQTQEFLNLAITQFSWSDARIVDAWWEHDGNTWQEVAQEYPRLFPERE